VPVDCRDLALLVARYHGDIHRAANWLRQRSSGFWKATDACADPRFEQLLSKPVPVTFMVVAAGRTFPIRHRRSSVRPWRWLRGVDAAAIARSAWRLDDPRSMLSRKTLSTVGVQ
jgi:tRNA nucleotidyltransferase (CCA-adding enzyme)